MTNAFSLLGLLVTIISVIGAIRFSLRQVIRDFTALAERVDRKFTQYDKDIADLDKRTAVIEKEQSMVIGWLKDMRSKIDEIYKNSLGVK